MKHFLSTIVMLCVFTNAFSQKDTTHKHGEWKQVTLIKLFKKKPCHKDTSKEAVSNFYELDLDALDTLSGLEIRSELDKDLCISPEVADESTSLRNTPAIMTVITHEQIRNMGARDLIDVFNLVPGFQFALDKNGNIGLGIRGNWANEGKVLMLIDGHEMNDIYTAKLNFGNHYPVSHIKRIEIIRGPGSAVYGGFAEYGVINIITMDADDMSGFDIGYNMGVTNEITARQHFDLYWAKRWKKSKIAINFFQGDGQRSTADHFALYPLEEQHPGGIGLGDYVSLKNNSQIKPQWFSARFNRGNFSCSLLGDSYTVQDINHIDNNADRSIFHTRNIVYMDMKYKWKIGKRLSLTPSVSNVAQFYEYKGLPEGELLLRDYMVRPKFSLKLHFKRNHRVNYVFGSEAFMDNYVETEKISGNEELKEAEYKNFAFYGQGTRKFPHVNITFGMRYARNPAFGNNFTPRLAFTKRFDKLHFKILLSEAFRAPAVGHVLNSFTGVYHIDEETQEVHMESGLEPETTNVFEFELGYKLRDNMFLTANMYDTKSDNTIIYVYYPESFWGTVSYENNNAWRAYTGVDVYQNAGKSGSRGFEIDYQIKDDWGSIALNYAHYSVKGKPVIPQYTISTFNRNVDDRIRKSDDQLLAFANHKFSMNSFFYFKQDFSLNISTNLYGSTYGYVPRMGDGYTTNDGSQLASEYDVTGALKKFSPTLITNIFVNYDNCIINGLNIGVGVYDAFNQGFTYLQPQFGFDSPVESLKREFYFKASYNFSFYGKKPKEF